MLLKSSSTTTNPYDNSFISIFVLSGDFPQIGRSELISILESNDIHYNIVDENSRIIILSFVNYKNYYEDLFKRIAYCNYFGTLLFTYDINSSNLHPHTNSITYLKNYQTFSVRKINVSTKLDNTYESIIGGLIKNLTPHLNVDLTSPDVSLIACKFNNSLLIFSNHSISSEPRWINRRPRARPFFLPFAIHPKLSRALVNLCRLNPGQMLFRACHRRWLTAAARCAPPPPPPGPLESDRFPKPASRASSPFFLLGDAAAGDFQGIRPAGNRRAPFFSFPGIVAARNLRVAGSGLPTGRGLRVLVSAQMCGMK